MYNGQLEMSFGSERAGQTVKRRQRRMARARWWFQCLRQAVNGATDWQPAPPPRPEQTWFPGAHRQVELRPSSPPQTASLEQRQVCE